MKDRDEQLNHKKIQKLVFFSTLSLYGNIFLAKHFLSFLLLCRFSNFMNFFCTKEANDRLSFFIH